MVKSRSGRLGSGQGVRNEFRGRTQEDVVYSGMRTKHVIIKNEVQGGFCCDRLASTGETSVDQFFERGDDLVLAFGFLLGLKFENTV